MNYYAPMETDAKHSLVAALLDATNKASGLREIESVRYATDASAFGQCNIPTLVFGPGNIAQPHTANEFIEINRLTKGLAVYNTFLAG